MSLIHCSGPGAYPVRLVGGPYAGERVVITPDVHEFAVDEYVLPYIPPGRTLDDFHEPARQWRGVYRLRADERMHWEEG